MTLAHELIVDYAKRAGAEAMEVIQIASTDVAVSERMGKQEKLERSEHQSVGLRVWVGDRQAIVSTDTSDENTLKELVSNAVAMAKSSPPDPFAALAEAGMFAAHPPALELADSIEPDVATLTSLCKKAESAALNVKGVTNSDGAEAGYSRYKIELMIAPRDGTPFVGSYQSTSYHTSISVVAGSGTNMEEDYAFSSTRFFSDLENASTLGIDAGERAVKRLNARKMPTCSVPIVWDKRVSKSLLGNFLSAINGNSIARKTSFLKDAMDRSIFAKGITITDDPHLSRGLGSKPFDGEGVQNKKTTLVENGELKSWLLDIRSANQLGLKTTGHASRALSSPPSPTSSNAYIHAGEISPEAMIAGISNGFYVTDLFGMGVNLITGDFSQGARGFWIERGEIAYPVSEITIAGKLQDMFLHTTAANDLEFKYATNAPTLLIEGMTIAGS
jgi:PmbA protein